MNKSLLIGAPLLIMSADTVCGVQREMKASGEKSGTEAISIGVGALQEQGRGGLSAEYEQADSRFSSCPGTSRASLARGARDDVKKPAFPL